eukprot:16420-Prymnesium_polylepis.2
MGRVIDWIRGLRQKLVVPFSSGSHFKSDFKKWRRSSLRAPAPRGGAENEKGAPCLFAENTLPAGLDRLPVRTWVVPVHQRLNLSCVRASSLGSLRCTGRPTAGATRVVPSRAPTPCPSAARHPAAAPPRWRSSDTAAAEAA